MTIQCQNRRFESDAMTSPSLLQTQQSPRRLPAACELAPGRAMTLLPRRPGVLRVGRGRLWITGDGPHSGALNEQGDHILEAGDEMRLRQDQRWVIEAWAGDAPASFSWEPMPEPGRGRPA